MSRFLLSVVSCQLSVSVSLSDSVIMSVARRSSVLVGPPIGEGIDRNLQNQRRRRAVIKRLVLLKTLPLFRPRRKIGGVASYKHPNGVHAEELLPCSAPDH